MNANTILVNFAKEQTAATTLVMRYKFIRTIDTIYNLGEGPSLYGLLSAAWKFHHD